MSLHTLADKWIADADAREQLGSARADVYRTCAAELRAAIAAEDGAVAWMRSDGKDVRIGGQLRDNWKADYTIPLFTHHAGPVKVTDEMVSRAGTAFGEANSLSWDEQSMRAALKAALNPGGSRE